MTTENTQPYLYRPGSVENVVESHFMASQERTQHAAGVSATAAVFENDIDNSKTAEEIMSAPYERKELSPENIEVTRLGVVSGDADRRWFGSISVASRLLKGEITTGQLAEAFAPNNVRKYIVRAFRSAHTRCVDGRPAEGYEENREEMHARELGAQTAGGTAGATICFRLAQGAEDDTYVGHTFEEDVEVYASAVKALGFEIGGHTDDHAPEHATGCGAIDKMREIVEVMTDTRHATRLKELTSAVLGTWYDPKIYSEMLGNAVLLQSESETYFKDYKQTVFKKLRAQAAGAIERLTGKHKEAGVIVNRIYGTTFHRDEFAADNDFELQAFNYDFWRSVEIAENFIHNHDIFQDMSESRKLIEAKKLLTARVMYTVATLMTLTDGTLELVVLDEKTDDGEIIDLFKDMGVRTPYMPRDVVPDAA